MQWRILSNREPQSSHIQLTCMCIAVHCLFGHEVTQQRRQPKLLISIDCFHPRKRALAASKGLAKGSQPKLLACISSQLFLQGFEVSKICSLPRSLLHNLAQTPPNQLQCLRCDNCSLARLGRKPIEKGLHTCTTHLEALACITPAWQLWLQTS